MTELSPSRTGSTSSYNPIGSEDMGLRWERSSHSTRDCYAKIWCDRCKAGGKLVNMYKSHKRAGSTNP